MSGFSDIIKAVAPGIATALGGPLAGAAVSFLADKLGVSEPTQDKIQQILAGTDPVKMRELELDFQKFMAENGIKLDLAQIEVNKEEAKSTNWFVAGPRPAVLWVCAFGLLYVSLLEPIARFICTVGFHYAGTFPMIDTSLTMQVLLGLLGLSGMRTYEKRTGTEKNR